MTAAIFDHLWQSTFFAASAGLLTLLFRRNGAALRHGLWFAASLKFLVPFALLSALGESLRAEPPIADSLSKAIRRWAVLRSVINT